eukprot:jgi/Orpsp1_1/1182847/evm.model.c7180000082875.1
MNDRDNEKKYGRYPLLVATAEHNNIDMVKVLMNYANEEEIKLELNEIDIRDYCENFNWEKFSEISPEIFDLWRNYGKIEKI